jgi:hypothetical protein
MFSNKKNKINKNEIKKLGDGGLLSGGYCPGGLLS